MRRGLVDVLVVISEDRREFLAERGVEAEVVPRGYHPSFGADLGGERDLDVLFLGALDVPRRRRILRGLERAGIPVLARGDWNDPRYWARGLVLLATLAVGAACWSVGYLGARLAPHERS